MSFSPPLDLIRQEVPAGRTGIVSYWPTVTGTGNVTATSASFSVTDQGGNLKSGFQAATIVAVAGVGSRIDCLVDAGSLGLRVEDYFTLTLRWRTSGDSQDREVGIAFDVAKYPFDESIITYSDLVGARPGAIEVIEHAAERLGLTPQQYGSMVGYYARAELSQMVRSKVEADAPRYPDVYFLRGHAILDVNRLKYVEVALALRELYGRNMTGSVEDGDPNASLLAFYRAEVDSRWRSVGALRYDLDDDGVAESEMAPRGGSIEMMREQG